MKATISIEALDGPAFRVARHGENTFAGGFIGQRYQVRIENLHQGRVLAVVTVDGRNVIDSSPGDIHGPGYLIRARGSYACDGWRTSDTTVAEFVLTTPAESYAAGLEGACSSGVVGVAIFAEAQAVRPRPAPHLGSAGTMPGGITRGATRGARMPAAASAGTGFGNDRASAVTSETFTRSGPPEIHVIRYDTIGALVAAGIMPAGAPGSHGSAFPASDSAYCQRPVNRS